MQVSESSDEEYEDEGAINGNTNDVEGAVESAQAKPRDPNKPQVDEVIPVYRRDCHKDVGFFSTLKNPTDLFQVFAGSHQYPGRGVYLLKFDNSYSLWRSKTLYYRVFYSK